MTVEELKERKRELGYSNEQVAELSGVPLGTVQKIFAGVTKTPRYDTLMALEQVLGQREHRIEEAAVLYNSASRYRGDKQKDGRYQGFYTVDDYYEMPEEERVELIDGVLYDMASPTSIHQFLCMEIRDALQAYIRREKGECIAVTAPLDVQLNCDKTTMIQPDVMVICDRKKIERKSVQGAPDMVVEVLSEATRRKDMVIKLNKYMSAGVREYWIVDPDKKKVIVYDFEGEDYLAVYGFDTEIPVAIFDGKCVVNFREIYDYISFLYEK